MADISVQSGAKSSRQWKALTCAASEPIECLPGELLARVSAVERAVGDGGGVVLALRLLRRACPLGE